MTIQETPDVLITGLGITRQQLKEYLHKASIEDPPPLIRNVITKIPMKVEWQLQGWVELHYTVSEAVAFFNAGLCYDGSVPEHFEEMVSIIKYLHIWSSLKAAKYILKKYCVDKHPGLILWDGAVLYKRALQNVTKENCYNVLRIERSKIHDERVAAGVIKARITRERHQQERA